MKKITIAFVHHTMKRGGGSEQVIYNLIRGLDQDIFRPLLCCLYGLGELGEALKAEGYCTYQHIIDTPYNPGNILRVASILKREKTNTLYVTDAFHNMIVGRLAALIARTSLSVIGFHTYDTIIRQSIPPYRKFIAQLADKLMHPLFHRILALSESHKQYLITTKHIPARKISTVYVGIDIQQFARPVDTQVLRHSLDIPEDAQIVGIAAGLRRWKAHDLFLNAAAISLKELPQLYFVIAGDGPERSNLEKMAQNLGISQQVRFLGVVDNVPAIFQMVDLAVLSSVHEAFPLVLLEAMAATCPVVATDVGSVAEIVEDGVNGFLVPPGATEQFAQSMLRILQDPQLARRCAEEGHRRVVQKHRIEGMAHRFESLILEWQNSKTP